MPGALDEGAVIGHPQLVAVLDRLGNRDEAGAVAGTGRAQQHPSGLVVLGVVEDVEHRAELVPGPVEHHAALPPTRDVECRHRGPPPRAGTAAIAAVVGWYGADVSEVRVAATVVFDSYDRLAPYSR
jgi:hypothetical protein